MSHRLAAAHFGLPALADPVGSSTRELFAFRSVSSDRTTWAVWDGSTARTSTLDDADGTRPVQWDPTTDRLFYTASSGAGDGGLRAWADDASEWVTSLPAGVQLCAIDPSAEFIYYCTANAIKRYETSTDCHDAVVSTEPLFLPELTVGCSPTGNWLSYTTCHEDRISIHLIESDGSDETRLEVNDDDAAYGGLDWSQDGELLLLRKIDVRSESCLGIYHAPTESTTWIDVEDEIVPIGFVTVTGEERVLVRRNHSPTETTAAICDLDGTLRDLPIEGTVGFDHRSMPTVSAGPDAAIVLRETWTTPSELLVVDLASRTVEQSIAPRVDSLNSAELVPPQRIEIPRINDTDIEAYLFDSGVRPSPILVKPYSARPSWGNYYRPYLQYLVAAGYSIVLPEYFYVDEPLFDDREHRAFAAVGRWARDQGWTDDNRIGLIGHSHGGYDVIMQLLLYPDQWNAAVAAAPVVDLFTHHRQKDEASYIEHEIGSPEANETTWRAQNPLTHAANLETPLLLLHGTEDDNVTRAEIMEFRRALSDVGGESRSALEFYELDGHGHAPSTETERVEKWTTIKAFFDRKL